MANRFQDIGISSDLEEVLKENRIVEPTPVQRQAIPELLNGKDVIAQAYTGTGKTFAFMLPILENIDKNKSHIQALIITPTRELAIQITNETKKLTEKKDINVLAAYGGQDVEGQLRKLKRGVHIVIGTPGRLLDHMRRGSINLGHLKMFVIDEADEMLQMGFLDDIEEILKETPKQRQTMLFSATIPNQLKSLAKRYMKNPVQIKIQDENVTLDEIKQLVVETTHREKQDDLLKIIDEQRPFMAIIFCRTKRRVIDLNNSLRQKGYNSDEIHGDLSQAKRERVMRSFRKMEIQLLVATDVASRGLDVEGITHIFNYDIPENVDSYIHRIGRTGRAGESGLAITFVTPEDKNQLLAIEKKIKMDIKSKGSNTRKKKPYKTNKRNKSAKRSTRRNTKSKRNKKSRRR